tara:strand:- start:550 stop:807 length:258 start_codon:yes stop_codon:yes gene_type:complete
MRYKDKDGYQYNFKCRYVNNSNTCSYCEPAYEVPMTLELRKLLTALDGRGSLYEKPYINLDKGELSYDEFERIKDITEIKTKKGE